MSISSMSKILCEVSESIIAHSQKSKLNLATQTVHVHWCVHAASSCLQIVLTPYCWSVAFGKLGSKKKKVFNVNK